MSHADLANSVTRLKGVSREYSTVSIDGVS